METKKPLVSVLMTAYNREKYIAESIESVVASTYSNIELIIVDDVSTDNTLEIAKGYEKLDKRIKVYKNEKNLKDYPNRNKAAAYATGKYIKYLDSDDKIYDWGLAYCVDMMEKYPQAGLGIFQNKNKIEQEVLDSKQAIKMNFFEQHFLNIGPSGTIMNREAFEQAGNYNESYGVPSDMFFNLKMAANFPVVILKEVFFFYRVHDGQEIHNSYSYLYNNYPYIRDAMNLPEMPLSSIEKEIILKRSRNQFFRCAVRYGLKTFQIRKVLKACRHSQISLKDLVIAGLKKNNI